MLVTHIRRPLVGPSTITGLAVLLILMSVAASPAWAACMPGGPCISVQPYTPHGMGSGNAGATMGAAYGAGAILGDVIIQMMNNSAADANAAPDLSPRQQYAKKLNEEAVADSNRLAQIPSGCENRQIHVAGLKHEMNMFRKAVPFWPENNAIRANVVQTQAELMTWTWCGRDPSTAELKTAIEYTEMSIKMQPSEARQKTLANLKARLTALDFKRQTASLSTCEECSRRLLTNLSNAVSSSALVRQHTIQALAGWENCSRRNACPANSLANQVQASCMGFADDAGTKSCVNHVVSYR